MYRVYISASTQKENIGLSTYGTEQARMMQLADRVAYWLASQKGKFQVFRNFYNWTLSQTIADCNGLNCIMFVDNHSNAGSPEACGTEAYFHDGSTKGEKLAKAIYNQVAPISPGKDRGVMRDTVLYPSGLAVLKGTNCPATLVEHMFHTNQKVSYIVSNSQLIISNLAENSIVRLFDISGRLLMVKDGNKSTLEISLPIKGIYHIQVQNNIETSTRKVVNW